MHHPLCPLNSRRFPTNNKAIYTATHFVVIANLRGSSIIRARRHCAATREELRAPTRCQAERESCAEKTVVFIIIKIKKTNLLPALFKAGTRYRNRFVDKKAVNFMANTGSAGGAARMFSYRCSSVPFFMIHNVRLILHFSSIFAACVCSCSQRASQRRRFPCSSGVYTMRNKGFSLRRTDTFSEIKIDFFSPLAASRSIRILPRSHSHKPRR